MVPRRPGTAALRPRGRLAILRRVIVVRRRSLAPDGSFVASVRTAVAWALVVALTAPPVAAAQPAPDDLRPKVEALLEAANQASEAGEHATAAERFAEAVALLPEDAEHRDGRAVALLDSVRARRRVFAEQGDMQQLCAARELIDRYADEAAAAYGIGAAEMDGPSAAARERREIDDALNAAGKTCSDGQVVSMARAPEAPGLETRPQPARPRTSPLKVAGITTLGVAGALFVMMFAGLGVGQAAESAGRDLRRDEPTRDIDALLYADFYRRGQAGNTVAIVGGVLGALAAGAGATMLSLGARSRGRVAVRVDPAGLAVRLRF